MYKKWLLGLFLVLISSAMAENITGFWQTINKKTQLPSSVIAIYPYEGKYYGRIVATYNKKGVIDDTIYNPKDRAPGIQGNPFYSGLDIVVKVSPEKGGRRYKGHIIDPKGGKIYNAELWEDRGNLILRGEVFIFGKNEVWPPFPEEEFNSEFKKPDLKSFVPNIPKVIN